MQDSITKSFVQRLISEQGFRESAQQAFQQAESITSSDLLQRCRALNACLKQGLVPTSAPDPDSSSDSDISGDSDCESTCSIAACQDSQQASLVIVQQVTSQPFVHAKPTPVRHAAAITIQRYYRQRHSTSQLLCTNTDPDSGLNQSRATANSATANIKAVSIGLVSTDTGSTDTGSTDTASTDSNGTDLTRQQAAVHIQRSWCRYCINAQATAEVAGLSCQIAALPLADQQASTGCQQGQQLTRGNHQLGDKPDMPVEDKLNKLAEVRIGTAAGLRRISGQGDRPAAELAPTASAVVQRAVERARQVQGMEELRLALQMGGAF